MSDSRDPVEVRASQVHRPRRVIQPVQTVGAGKVGREQSEGMGDVEKLEGGEGRDVLILVMCSLHSMTYNKIPPLRKLQCMPAGMRRKKYWEEGGVILLSRCPESRGASRGQRR